MLIQSSIRSSAVPSKEAGALAAHAADDSHVVSVTPDVARTFTFRAGQQTGIGDSLLQALEADGDDPAAKHLRSTVLKAAKTAISADPLGKGAVKGVELILSSREAYTLFADSKAKPIKKLDSAAAALKDAIGAAQACWPSLKDNRYVQVASLIVTVGGMVIKVEADLSDEKAKPHPWLK